MRDISNILDEIVRICVKDGNINKVILYGSRAKGTNMERSDIDIALKGSDLNIELINDEIDEIETLLKIDLVDIENCNNELLKKEVEDYGVTLYSEV